MEIEKEQEIEEDEMQKEVMIYKGIWERWRKSKYRINEVNKRRVKQIKGEKKESKMDEE